LNNSRVARRLPIFIIILAALVLGACGRVADSNWPGITADANTVFVAYGPGVVAIDVVEQEQLWYYPPAGSNQRALIYAPPSVSDGKIVIGDYGQSGGMLQPKVTVSIHMIDEENPPQTRWTQSEIAQDRIIAQPLQVGDIVFVGTADNNLYALDSENNGQPIWDGPFEVGHSIWGQSAYEEGILYVTSLDKSVYALNVETKEVIWQTNVGGSVTDKPVLNGDLLYVSSFDKQLHALDKISGESRWTAAAGDAIWGAPAFDGKNIYFADLRGTIYAVGAESGEPIWEYETGEYVVASPVIHEGKVYLATGGRPNQQNTDTPKGSLFILDSESHELIDKLETQLPVYSTPVIVNDLIVLAMNGPEEPLIVLTVDTTDTDRTTTTRPEVPAE